jgi:hypothetical protein
MTNKDVGIRLVTGYICLLQYSVIILVSGATATHHSSQFTTALLGLLFKLLELSNCVLAIELSQTLLSLSLELAHVFNFSYLGSYRCTIMGTPASAFPDSVLSITAGNKYISVCHRRHMLQQAGYQEHLYSLSQKL